MIKLSQEILESIDKQLTKDAAGRLAEFIKNSEKLEQQLFEKDGALVGQINQNNILKKENEELNKLNLQKDRIEKEQIDLYYQKEVLELNQKRFEIEKQLLQQKVDLALSSKQDIYNLVNLFVSNPRAIEFMSINKSFMNESYYDGSRQQKVATSSFETGTVEKREIKS